MSKSKQHVVPTVRGGWAVRRSGASRASRIFTTQQDAVTYAKEVARREGSDVYVHRVDGTITKRDTYESTSLPEKH